MRWNLSELGERGTAADETSRTFTWQQDTTGAKFSHSVFLQTTAGAPRYNKAAILRMVGHFLLSRMPDEGLAETCQSLAENYDYYLTRARTTLEVTCPTPQSYGAPLAVSNIRPLFPIAEEE